MTNNISQETNDTTSEGILVVTKGNARKRQNYTQIRK